MPPRTASSRPAARSPSGRRSSPAAASLPHLLVTAGPTYEPIDRVRFIGNRSSGRLGIELATHAAAAGWRVTLLLGPVEGPTPHSRLAVHRFRTTADLQALLGRHFPAADALVMAAAVADYRPASAAPGKLRRSATGLTLKLVATPDLLAECGRRRTERQTLVGFALEPAATLVASAKRKLRRKNVDFIVANPLETIDSPTINATIVGPAGVVAATGRPVTKRRFAAMLLNLIAAEQGAR